MYIFLLVIMLSRMSKVSGFVHMGRNLGVSLGRFSLYSTDKKEEAQTGHQTVQSEAMTQMSDEDQAYVAKLQEHQKSAARLSNAVEVRTLVENSSGYGVLSTNSKAYDGYPTGSVVGFALDDEGYPFFVFSSMSAHTGDVMADGRVSLTVMASDFKGAAEGRVVMIGDTVALDDSQKSAYRDMYLKRHPDAFWIDFGDFSYWKLNSLKSLRYIGGFARAGSLSPREYLDAEPDPVAPFAAPVMKHMNDDHADSTVDIVKNVVGVPGRQAQIVGLDALGMTVKAVMDFAGGGIAKVRIPFDEPVLDRKGIKRALVTMTQAAAGAREG